MLRKIILIVALMCLPLTAMASNVVQVVRVYDTSGNPVSGVSFTAGGVALTAGVSATTVPGTNLDTGAALTNQTLKYYDPADGTGEYFFVYDPSSTEAHFALVASKSGATISNATTGLNFYADPSVVASTNAQTAASAQQSNTQTAMIAQGYTTTRATKIDDLDATISSRSTFAGGAVASVTGNVGGISGITFPSNFGTFSIDGAGKVTLTASEHTAISGTDFPAALNTAQPGSPVAGSPFAHLASADTQATAAAASAATTVSQTTPTALAHSVWNATLDPTGSTPVVMANALFDIWEVNAGPIGTITYSGSVQTTPYKWNDGTTAGLSSALTTNTSGKPLSRTPTIGTRPSTP